MSSLWESFTFLAYFITLFDGIALQIFTFKWEYIYIYFSCLAVIKNFEEKKKIKMYVKISFLQKKTKVIYKESKVSYSKLCMHTKVMMWT